MVRTRMVLAGALALAIVSCGGIVLLQHRMRTSEDARISVVRTESLLNRLQGPPWEVMNPGYGTVKQIRAQVGSEEGQLLASAVALKRNGAVSESDGLSAALRRNFASLDLIMKLGIQSGWRNVAQTNAASQDETLSLATASRALSSASSWYGSRVKVASQVAAGGAVAAIFLLFVAFAVFFLRSSRTQRSLGAALAHLSRAQEERGKLLARTVEVAEHERIRVAAELHDGPVQHLTALAFTIDQVAGRLQRGEPETVPALLSEVRGSLAREMDSLRRLMVELRPPVLSQRGLAAALNDLAANVFGGEKTACTVSCNVDAGGFAPELETVVYRVVGEALINARKHAEARLVNVNLDMVEDSLRLVITDDGKGFGPTPLESGRPGSLHGYGLIGIRERIEGLGGGVRIDGRHGRGVRIEGTLPVIVRRSKEAAHKLAVA